MTYPLKRDAHTPRSRSPTKRTVDDKEAVPEADSFIWVRDAVRYLYLQKFFRDECTIPFSLIQQAHQQQPDEEFPQLVAVMKVNGLMARSEARNLLCMRDTFSKSRKHEKFIENGSEKPERTVWREDLAVIHDEHTEEFEIPFPVIKIAHSYTRRDPVTLHHLDLLKHEWNTMKDIQMRQENLRERFEIIPRVSKNHVEHPLRFHGNHQVFGFAMQRLWPIHPRHYKLFYHEVRALTEILYDMSKKGYFRIVHGDLKWCYIMVDYNFQQEPEKLYEKGHVRFVSWKQSRWLDSPMEPFQRDNLIGEAIRQLNNLEIEALQCQVGDDEIDMAAEKHLIA